MTFTKFKYCKTAIWFNLKLGYESVTPHYCIPLYSTVLCLQPQRSSMHAYTYKYNSMCACVCMCVLDAHARVCMCICMYVCGSYNIQNGMEPTRGSLYFNCLSSFVCLLNSLFYRWLLYGR